MTGLTRGWFDVIGQGRMGSALAAAMRTAGLDVRGPLGRGTNAAGATVVLLCVPDREIAAACAALDVQGALVGHVSASAPLELLSPHERFVMHPLLSVAGTTARFRGVTCAVDGSTPRAIATARELASALGMRARDIAPAQRALYHAAASMAANYLVTVESASERLAAHVGLDREALLPLVRSAVDEWAARGGRAALTGPIARGDRETVERQRAAVREAEPSLLPLWDALAAATGELASTPRAVGA